jgi:hypothetical protein
MNLLANFMRRISGNHVAQNHFKEGIKEMLKQAIDSDDEDAFQEATAMFYELRGNGRLLPESSQPRQFAQEVHAAKTTPDDCTDYDTLREAATAVMFACHKLGITTVTSYDLFNKVDVEMVRRGGWQAGDLAAVPYQGRKGNPRPIWRENLSRVVSQMKIDGELTNPSTRQSQTYCLGPQLLAKLLPAREPAPLPVSIDIKPLNTTPLPAEANLPDWQAIN